jgi:hypothetical protein
MRSQGYIRSLKSLGASLAIPLLLSCGDTGFNPTMETVAGSYEVTTLRETRNGITIDDLALGVTLRLDLMPDGTATGHLFAPHGEEDGSDLDTDLSGTWSLTGSTVTLILAEDTFVNDVTFTAERNTLRADHTFSSGVRLEVILTRTQ